MKETEDKLVISHAPTAPDGTKLEPEEKPVQRIISVGLPLVLSTTGETISESVPGSVAVDMTAGEVASRLRQRCENCIHFDHDAWREYYHELRVERLNDPGAQAQLNQMRAAIDLVTDEEYLAKHRDADAAEEIDIDHAMNDLGICWAMTEIESAFRKERSMQIVAPEAGCPDRLGPNGENYAMLFQPKNRAADRSGSRMHDFIMRIAQGK